MRQHAQRLVGKRLSSLVILFFALSGLGVIGVGAYLPQPGEGLAGIAGRVAASDGAQVPSGSASVVHEADLSRQFIGPEHPEVARARFLAALHWAWPAFGEITTPFGEPGPHWVGGFHQGVDFAVDHGTDVRAAAHGLVIEADDGWNRGYGTYIKIDHGYGVHTLYAHLSHLAVELGEEVKRGQVIGHAGDSGYSIGPHLHFEVHIGGELSDPLLYLP